MKFKNYVNSLTGDNRIFSNKEIANMTVKEAFGRQDEIMAQHSQIGIPSEKELQASDNVVHVNAYTREDGTEVKAHYRSKPDGIISNNLSANVQKTKSESSDGTPTGGASSLNAGKQNLLGKLNNKETYIDNKGRLYQFLDNEYEPTQIKSGLKIFEQTDEGIVTDSEYNNKLNNRNLLYVGKFQEELSESTEIQGNFIKPIEGKITSGYGKREQPIPGASENHSGIDYAADIGTPVKSIADGTVTAANGGMTGYGNGVFIDHGVINGKRVRSEYGHLSGFEVKVGDKVKQGDIVAKSGNSGISSGPHLHLTIREYDEKTRKWYPVNPDKYLKY